MSARADRIERRRDGSYAILDYKTGAPPTGKQVRMGLSPQLTLEAAILREGGFADIDAGSSVGELAYVRLSGNNPPGEHKTLELKIKPGDTPQPPDDAADYARAQLEALIRRFENPDEPYRSLVLSMWTARYGRLRQPRPRQGMVGRRRPRAGGMVKAPRTIPPAVRDAQARASDPAASAFVSANAGSGKTHVLVQRVIRLLLSGVPPEKILCLTFTKAAAANMAERVFTTLGHWVTLDDDRLDAAIRDAGIAHPSPSLRKAARELFASALETPGGLKVQTIHALCTRLLQQFPFEANVPARFAVLDDRDQTEMMERASLAVLLDASRAPDSAIGRALLGRDGERRRRYLQGSRARGVPQSRPLHGLDRCAGSADAAARRYRQRSASAPMTVSRMSSARSSTDRTCRDHAGRRSRARSRPAPRPSATTRTRFARRSRPTGAAQVDEYLGVFLTDTDRTPRKSVMTKNFVRDNPALGRRFDAEIGRLVPLIEKRRALTVRDRTEALLHIATRGCRELPPRKSWNAACSTMTI